MGGYALEEVKEVNDQAQNLVTERFGLAETVAKDQVTAAKSYLTALSSVFSLEMPTSEISYGHQSIVLDSSLKRPEDKTIELSEKIKELRSDLVNSRTLLIGELVKVTVPTITIPEYTLDTLENDLEFAEPIYQSNLQDALKLILKDFVENGGTGLGADVEDALWERAKARQDLLNERTYNEAEEYFASRGFTIPPGALGGRLTEALAEQTRGDAQLNYEISIEQAKLARAQTEHAILAAISLEGQDKEKFTAMANRTLEAAKAAAAVVTDLYDKKLREFAIRWEAKKSEVEIEKLKVDVTIAANDNSMKIYALDVDQYKIRLQSELTVLELIAKVYGFTVAGYEADAKVAAADLDAQVKAYQGRIDQTNNQAALSLKEAEVAIQGYLGAIQITAEAAKAGGNICAQIAASALSAVNASASLGAHAASSYGSASQYSKSGTDSLSEIHYYDETAP